MTSLRSGNQRRKQEVHSREYVVLDSEGEVELETGTDPFDEDPFENVMNIDGSLADNVKHAWPHSNSSPAEEANIREAPRPMFASHESVDRRVYEPPEHSDFTPEPSLQQHVHSRSHQRNLNVSSISQHSQMTSPSPTRKGATKSSMQLTSKPRQTTRERLKGDSNYPIELGSSDSDSDNEDSNSFPQREGPTSIRTASLNIALSGSSGSANNLPSITKSRKATNVSSVSDSRESSINARTVTVKNPTCETCRMVKRRTRCTHRPFKNEDSGKIQRAAIARTDGQVSVVVAATQQSTSEETTGDGDSHSEEVYAPTPRMATGASASNKLRSPSRANYNLETPTRPDSETGSVKGVVGIGSHPEPSKDISPPIRLPVTPANESDDSEDSDPPMSFPLRRRLGRLKHANTPNSLPTSIQGTKTQRSADAMSDSSGSDEPLLPTWEKPLPNLSTGLINSRIDDDVPRSSSQVQQDEDVRNPEMCSKTEQALLDDTSSSSSRDSPQRRRTSNASVSNDESPKLHAAIPEMGRHTTSSRSSRRVIRMPARFVDQSREGPLAHRLRSHKPSSSKRPRVEPSVASSREATESFKMPNLGSSEENTEPVKQKPKLGLADIIPKEGPPKKTSLTLRDIVPRKRSRKTKLPRQLRNFQDNVRTAFAPFLVGPEEILNAPPKKRKFTLADVIGMPQEPLFNIDEVIEQYLARQGDGEQQSEARSDNGIAEPAMHVTAEEQTIANGGEGRKNLNEEVHVRNDQDRENMPTHDGQDPIECTADKATDMDLSEMLDDAEAFLAGEESTNSGNDVEGASSARRGANPEPPKPGHPLDARINQLRGFGSLSRCF